MINSSNLFYEMLELLYSIKKIYWNKPNKIAYYKMFLKCYPYSKCLFKFLINLWIT